MLERKTGMKLTAALLLTGFLTLCCGLATASLIVQGTGENFVAFEAQSYRSFIHNDNNGGADRPWATLISASTVTSAPAGASQGDAMWVQGETTSGVEGIDGGIHDRRIDYTIRFDQAGVYRLYYRGYVPVNPDPLAEGAPSGNNDSFYVLSSFGDPSIDGNYSQEFPASLTSTWDWADSGNTYTVTAGEEVTWAWAQREDGPAFDRFVFSQTVGLSDGQLDGLANSAVLVPEPTTVLGLISLFVAAGVRRRRRSLVISGSA